MSGEREVELFGGAIRCRLPATAVDVSDFRQVPDTQEVYTEAETGVCIIIELLARQADVLDEDCGAFFFSDLARANDCRDGDFTLDAQQPLAPADYPHVAQLPCGAAAASGRRCAYGCVTSGLQRISKFKNERGKDNEVFVALAVLRFLPSISSDVLLSVSAPQWIHPESSEACVVRHLRGREEVLAVLHRAVSSFEVRDWSLFVPED
ncbi:Ran-binding protein [Trypanosoma rangeli]|uniref:Ran-binding protein n=1 Tax=Trypanosoma rangeli TaxID=5698 RepID=A0A422NXZ5_TRYRA|nr:Ran-binding protein [Trypanosoma rangeli]RNF10274.1 Ran-binding protein [Trypanosoma rangeli]|eukprot:RNF10274.1 Ran-binding protein [Trypanosoma rangeli]